jgi:N-acyl-D-aspartate/D-glutamate deacylase
MLSISPWHGVTSVIMGNCGFGIAPTRADMREFTLRTLEQVEDIAYEASSAFLGPDWGFETFREYLNLLETRGLGINVGVLIGHNALRLWVMGTEAGFRHPTQDEIEQMRELIRDALDAGAIGFSTSNSPAHTDKDGHPVPSRVTTYEELEALVGVLGEAGRGTMQTTWGPEVTKENIRRLMRATGAPVCDPAVKARPKVSSRENHWEVVKFLEECLAEGLHWYPQITSLPTTFEATFLNPFMFALDQPKVWGAPPLDELFVPVINLDTDSEKKAAYRSPEFRHRFRELTDDPKWHSIMWPHTWFLDVPGHDDIEERSIGSVAAEREMHPADLLLDLADETDFALRIGVRLGGADEDEMERLLHQPTLRLGLSDAGAHVNQLCDSRYPTHVLGYWVRERQSLTLERAIQMMTSLEAEAYGIDNRGALLPGMAADIVVFDPETVASVKPHIVHDLPNDAPRKVAESVGIDHVIVNGVPIRSHGKDNFGDGDALPGAILRPATWATRSMAASA